MTIYDIAKAAGVSACTVSRVINGKAGMSEATREKIQKLLDEYGYTPNETARGLANKETKLIGILILDIRYTFHIQIAYNIQSELLLHGYCSLILNTGHSDEKKVEAIRLMEQRRVDGVVLVGSTFECESVKSAIKESLSDIPVVMTNGYLPLPNVHGILVNEKEGIEDCVRLLIKKGHQKLAFVLPNRTRSNLDKREGFQTEMERQGVARENQWIYEAPTSVEDGYNIMTKILKEHPDVEGVVCAEDLAAVGAIRALHDAGRKIPEEIALIGVDNSSCCEMCFPKLSSLNNRMEELSNEAGRILIDCLQGKENPERIMLYCAIQERETT